MATRCQLTANYPFSMSAKCQQLLIRVPVIPCGLVNMPWCARTGPKSAQFCQHWALRGNDWGWNPILLCNNVYTHVLCGGWGYTGFLLFICPLSVFCSSLCDLGRCPDDKSFHQILKNFGTCIIWVKILQPWIRAFTFGMLRTLKVIPDISPRFCQILIFVVFWIFYVFPIKRDARSWLSDVYTIIWIPFIGCEIFFIVMTAWYATHQILLDFRPM